MEADEVLIEYMAETSDEISKAVALLIQRRGQGGSIRSVASEIREMAQDLADTAERLRKIAWRKSKEG